MTEPNTGQTGRRPKSSNDMLRNGILALLGAFTAVMLYHILQSETTGFFDEVIRQHTAATLGLPLAALGALGVVLLLRSATGPMELEALGFKFKGAAAPVIMWVAVFLSIVASIKLLW